MDESDFKVYGPYYNGRYNRQIVIVVDRNGKKRTISYPKWILECQLGRKLDSEFETVHHIDGDHENNDINNLRVVPRSEHSADDTRRVKEVELECAWCGKKFKRSPRLLREKAKKGARGPFCSRVCSGKYSRMLQLKLIDKFDKQKAVDSEYYKRKNASFIISSDLFIDYLCYIMDDEIV